MKCRFLIFERDSFSYHCGLIHEGIRRFFSKGEHELTFLPLGLFDVDSMEPPLTDDQVAIICWFERGDSLDRIRNMGIPYLNLSESEEMSNLDIHLTFGGEGRLAAEFFINELGLESLAFIGGRSYSHRRRSEEFRLAAERKRVGVKVHFLPSVSAKDRPFIFDESLLNERRNMLTGLLRNIPKPAGIFCADDRLALNLYYRAQQLEIKVPEDISILGVGSLKRAEDGGVNAISVVQMDHIKQGYVAARLIEEALSGNASEKRITLSPDGIVHRATTARRAVKDALVKKAMEIIDHDRSINVIELSRRLDVSRRTLEKRFLAATHMNVAKAIEYQRFQHAKQLLKSHRYNHESIASLAGYRNHRQMIRSFERIVQMSPKQYSQAYLRS